MASNLKFSQTVRQAKLDAITTAVGNAGLFKLYDGTQPSTPNTALSGNTLGATLTCGSPFAPAASAANPSVLSPTLPTAANAVATITPTFFRVTTSGGTAVIDGTAGTSGTDAILNAATVTNGQNVSVTAWTITGAN